MKLLRCHNMIPSHVKWYVSQWKGATETWLFFGTRKQCEAYIREHSNGPDLFGHECEGMCGV